ncbi:hypothetical protein YASMINEVIRUS_77, partial [Yasminevirus sp. GU-2018]
VRDVSGVSNIDDCVDSVDDVNAVNDVYRDSGRCHRALVEVEVQCTDLIYTSTLVFS